MHGGCDVATLGHYRYQLSDSHLQRLGNEEMQKTSFVADFHFNTDNNKVLHLGGSVEQSLVSDLKTAETLLVDSTAFNEQAIPESGIIHLGFINDESMLGQMKMSSEEDPNIAQGKTKYSLVATDINNKKYQVLHSINVDQSSQISPFLALKQSPSGRFVSFSSFENQALTGIEKQGMFLLDTSSMKVIKTFDKQYIKFRFTPDETGVVMSDAEELVYISTDGAKRHTYNIYDKKLRVSTGSRRLDNLNIVGDQLFYVNATKFGNCGLRPGTSLYSIPIQNGQLTRVSKQLKDTCGVFIVNVNDNQDKIYYVSFQESGKSFGVYEVDITNPEYTSKQLFVSK